MTDNDRHHVNLLSDALAAILIAARVVGDQPLTGPQLLLLANDYTDHLRRQDRPDPPPLPGCAYCEAHGHDHREPGSKPMSAFVTTEVDSDGQPTHLVVSYAAGEHVGEGEAELVRRAIREYRP